MRMIFCASAAALAVTVTHAGDATGPEFVHPLIQNGGEVVVLPDAALQPKAGSKTLFDITQHDDPKAVSKGLDRLARWVNVNAGAGVKPEDIQVVAVFHGDATKTVLNDDAYAEHTGEKGNPNLALLRELKAAGVTFYVCGQAMAHRKFAHELVVPEVTVATAALTVNVQKQQEGFARLPY